MAIVDKLRNEIKAGDHIVASLPANQYHLKVVSVDQVAKPMPTQPGQPPTAVLELKAVLDVTMGCIAMPGDSVLDCFKVVGPKPEAVTEIKGPAIVKH